MFKAWLLSGIKGNKLEQRGDLSYTGSAPYDPSRDHLFPYGLTPPHLFTLNLLATPKPIENPGYAYG